MCVCVCLCEYVYHSCSFLYILFHCLSFFGLMLASQGTILFDLISFVKFCHFAKNLAGMLAKSRGSLELRSSRSLWFTVSVITAVHIKRISQVTLFIYLFTHLAF